MIILDSVFSGITAVLILVNLGLLVAAVIWAMGGFSGNGGERRSAHAATVTRPAVSPHGKPGLRA